MCSNDLAAYDPHSLNYLCRMCSSADKILIAVGTTLVVGAIVFTILGNMQADWFTHAVGVVGDPNSWQLWTIVLAALLVGGGCFWKIYFSHQQIKREQDRLEEESES